MVIVALPILALTFPEMEFEEFEPRFKSAKPGLNLAPTWILKHFKWNQPYLSRGLNLDRRSNSLNSATVNFTFVYHFYYVKAKIIKGVNGNVW